jgi:polyribonucleotide nucleotidyltransferase
MTELFNITRKEIEWAGRPLVLETGKIARQATGSVVVSYGGSKVLCTVVGNKTVGSDVDFFPLTVHYLEKTYAVGRIPGGFIKRETKPSEKEVLASRLIDRPIRPLFPEGFYNEVQVVCTVLTYDFENDTEIAALIGASAALSISGIPFLGPIAGARVGYKDGSYILNPKPSELKDSQLELVVAGTKEGVLMVESEARELSEEIMLGAVVFGHESFQPVINLILDLKKEAGKPEWTPQLVKPSQDLEKQVRNLAFDDLVKAYGHTIKRERYAAVDAVREKVQTALAATVEDSRNLEAAFSALQSEVLRTDILKNKKRVDGRGLKNIRTIECEVGILPRTHGSALFTRGETQALVVTTLGTAQDEQMVDGLDGEYKERFMLHYNFPSYSVGETGRMGPPGRREVGHGKLAWRAINPIIPTREEFPYSMRTVSEITESNGSSSMATVCGTSLALMEAGVPLPRPVAGIAMGLIKEGKDFAVLSDILGDEDHLGDMDFKVAGTEKGITALQMDIKITSITPEIMKIALEQANEGRIHILSEMNKALSAPRGEVSDFAPRMVTIQINKDKIRDIIGPGGKMIREICEVSGAKIDIDDEGAVTVAGLSQESIDKAINMIKGIACDPEVGAIYSGKIVKIMDFGAFVNFMGSRDGLVHVSEIKEERVEKVADVLKVGETVNVKVLGFDDRGKIKLSMKGIAQG